MPNSSTKESDRRYNRRKSSDDEHYSSKNNFSSSNYFTEYAPRNSSKEKCNKNSSASNSSDMKQPIRSFGEWSEFLSSSGKIYYYNSKTEKAQWDKPLEWDSMVFAHEEREKFYAANNNKDYRNNNRYRSKYEHEVSYESGVNINKSQRFGYENKGGNSGYQREYQSEYGHATNPASLPSYNKQYPLTHNSISNEHAAPHPPRAYAGGGVGGGGVGSGLMNINAPIPNSMNQAQMMPMLPLAQMPPTTTSPAAYYESNHPNYHHMQEYYNNSNTTTNSASNNNYRNNNYPPSHVIAPKEQEQKYWPPEHQRYGAPPATLKGSRSNQDDVYASKMSPLRYQMNSSVSYDESLMQKSHVAYAKQHHQPHHTSRFESYDSALVYPSASASSASQSSSSSSSYRASVYPSNHPMQHSSHFNQENYAASNYAAKDRYSKSHQQHAVAVGGGGGVVGNMLSQADIPADMADHAALAAGRNYSSRSRSSSSENNSMLTNTNTNNGNNNNSNSNSNSHHSSSSATRNYKKFKRQDDSGSAATAQHAPPFPSPVSVNNRLRNSSSPVSSSAAKGSIATVNTAAASAASTTHSGIHAAAPPTTTMATNANELPPPPPLQQSKPEPQSGGEPTSQCDDQEMKKLPKENESGNEAGGDGAGGGSGGGSKNEHPHTSEQPHPQQQQQISKANPSDERQESSACKSFPSAAAQTPAAQNHSHYPPPYSNVYVPTISSSVEDINKYYRPELASRLNTNLGVVENFTWINQPYLKNFAYSNSLVDLKNFRSVVRVKEIKKTLQEQRLVFLQTQMKEIEDLLN